MLQFKHLSRFAALAAAGLFVVCSAHAAQTVSSRPGLRALSPTQRFVWSAAQTNLAEIGIGRLAEQNASSPAVKDFARMLVSDHTQNQKELQALADSQGFRLPTKLDRKHQAMFNQLNNLTGAQFDNRFAAMMVRGHQEAVQMFENASRSNSMTPGLRDFAKTSLPVLRQHLSKAQQLQTTVTANSRSRTSAPSQTAQPSQPVQTMPGTRSEQPTSVSTPESKPSR